MRIAPSLLGGVLYLVLVAGTAAADPVEPEQTAALRSSNGLAARYLPAEPRPDDNTIALVVMPAPAPVERRSPDTTLLSRILEVRLLGHAGPQPADPRRRHGTGDLALRVPLGSALAVGPGVRLDYARHPFEDLWTGEPTPTFSFSLRF